MRLSSLWEMGHFLVFAESVYFGTHMSFDSLGEDYSDSDSWYIHMLLLQGNKVGSQKVCSRLLSISPLEHEYCLTNFYLFHLFDRLSQRHSGMSCTKKGKIKQKNKHSFHLSFSFFSIRPDIVPISFSLFSKPKIKLFKSPILNTRQISSCFQVP